MEYIHGESATDQANRRTLLAALGAYEAVRFQFGPERDRLLRGIKRLLAECGPTVRKGITYRWCSIEDSLVRRFNPKINAAKPSKWDAIETPPARSYLRRGVDFGNDFKSLWNRTERGRAL